MKRISPRDEATSPSVHIVGRLRRPVAKLASWTLLFMSVFATYAMVLGLTSTIGDNDAPELSILLLTTAAVTVLIPRLRAGIDRWLDRLVFGGNAQSYEMVNSFVDRVASTLAVDDVMPRLAEVVARTVHGTRAEVSVRSDNGGVWQESWPPASQRRDDGVVAVIDVRHGGDVIGAIEIEADEALDRRRREALDELIGPAGLALSTVRLTFDLRTRAKQIQQVNVDLSASRQRIIDARRVEGDRLLDDVNRIVQPHLDAVQLHLDEMTTELEELHERSGPTVGTTDPMEALTLARAEAVEALEALRKLARGISSPILLEAGPIAALEAWGIQSMPAVVIRAVGDSGLLNQHSRVGATLYSVCVTAAEASARTGPIVVEIDAKSDAVGFHVPLSATLPSDVLQLLVDRAAAIDGSIEMAEDRSSGRPALVGRLPIVRREA